MLSIDPEIEDRLRKFHDFLEKWNRKINLVARGEEIWNRHILDSLQLLPYIKKEKNVGSYNTLVPYEMALVDIGSGGGFPGAILSIAGIQNIHLVESDLRKCQFLEEVKIKFSLDCRIHSERVENIRVDNVKFITSRAFADIEKIFQLSSHLVNSGTIYLLHKTQSSNKELDKAKKMWSFHVESLSSVTSKTHSILKLSDLNTVGS